MGWLRNLKSVKKFVISLQNGKGFLRQIFGDGLAIRNCGSVQYEIYATTLSLFLSLVLQNWHIFCYTFAFSVAMMV